MSSVSGWAGSLPQTLVPLAPSTHLIATEAELAQLSLCLSGPVAIGLGTRRTGVQYSTEAKVEVGEYLRRTALGEGADSNDPLRCEDADQFAQVGVTGRVEGVALVGGELVRGSVAARRLHEHERTVIGDVMILEEGFRGLPVRRDRAPEPRTAHLASSAVEAIDRTLGVFGLGPVDPLLDLEPVPDQSDLAEGDTGLCHAVGPGVHPEKDHAFRALCESPHVAPVAARRVLERVVDVADGRFEAQAVDLVRELARGAEDTIGMSHGRLMGLQVGAAGGRSQGGNPV